MHGYSSLELREALDLGTSPAPIFVGRDEGENSERPRRCFAANHCPERTARTQKKNLCDERHRLGFIVRRRLRRAPDKRYPHQETGGRRPLERLGVRT